MDSAVCRAGTAAGERRSRARLGVTYSPTGVQHDHLRDQSGPNRNTEDPAILLKTARGQGKVVVDPLPLAAEATGRGGDCGDDPGPLLEPCPRRIPAAPGGGRYRRCIAPVATADRVPAPLGAIAHARARARRPHA